MSRSARGASDTRPAGVRAARPLLERRHELGRIEATLAEACCAGHGRFVVIEGPAGIGKTTLLAAARTVAADAGMRVLRSRGAELERDFAFGVVRQLFEPPLADASELERADLLQAGAGKAASLLGLPGASAVHDEPSAGVDPSFAILHGLYWLCANLATAGPVCLVVDDAHWADAPSLRYLAFLLTRLQELDVALVLATRPREAGTDGELLATLTTDASAEVIRLPPLSRAAVSQLLEAELDEIPDPVFVEACLRVTRGTPFLMRALVEALREGGIASTADAAGQVERIGAQSVGRSVPDVHSPHRPQRSLRKPLRRRACAGAPPGRAAARRPTGRVRTCCPASARQRAGRGRLGRRTAARGRASRVTARRTRVSSGLPPPSARRATDPR